MNALHAKAEEATRHQSNPEDADTLQPDGT